MMRVISLLALLCAGHAAYAELVIREFNGIGRADTAAFNARSPWLIEWSSRPPTAIDHKPAHLEVYLYEVGNHEYVGRVVQHSGTGRGNVLIEQGGRFFLRVQSQSTEWKFRILQLDADDAERLKETPR